MGLLAVKVLLIIVISVIAVIMLVFWIVRSFVKKKYYLATVLLLVSITFFSWYFYKHTEQSVIKDFEESAKVKVPRNFQVISKRNSFLLIIDQMVILELQLDSVSTNQLICDIQKTKNYLPDNWFKIDYYKNAIETGEITDKNNWRQMVNYYLFSTEDEKGHFLVGLDSTKRTLSIQKNWSLFNNR